MVTAVLMIAAILLALRFLPEEEEHSVAWQDLSSQIGPIAVAGPQNRTFRERASLVRYLRQVGAAGPAPRTDFAARQLLIVSPGPRSSAGYSVEVLGARARGDRITVRVRERSPRVGEDVRPRVSYPYRLISLPAGRSVDVDWVGR